MQPSAAPIASADFYAATKHGDDAPDGCTKSDCTLREAILAANANPGRDRILLASNQPYRLSRGGLPDDGALRGDLDITNDPLRIYHGSNGWATIDARGVDRVFEIFAGAPTRLERLRITGGKHPSSFDGDGGGISDGCEPLACALHPHGKPRGGHGREWRGPPGSNQREAHDSQHHDQRQRGRRLVGRARHRKSRLHDQAQHDLRQPGLVRRRGVFLRRRELDDRLEHGLREPVDERDRQPSTSRRALGSLLVNRSTFSGNVAATDGGGFSARNGDVKFVNSTIADNRAGGAGGGLWALTPVTLNAVTIVRNDSDSDQAGGEDGGGIFVAGSGVEVKVRNTIVALNHLGDGTRNDCSGDPVMSLGHNLLSTKGPAGTCQGFDDASDRAQRPSPSRRPEAERRPHEDGRAATAGSPAIGHADQATAPARDQRGVLRHNPDIGAFERR